MTVTDTTFLIDLLRGDQGAVDLLAAFQQESWELQVPLAAVHELYRGLARAQHPVESLQRILHALDGLQVLPFNSATARISGDLEGGLRRTGEDIGPLDCQIAATALQQGVPVLTRNVGHFERVMGLQVQTY